MEIAKRIFGPEEYGTHDLFQHLLFLFSNNLLSQQFIANLVALFSENSRDGQAFLELLRSDSITARAVVERFFRSSLRTRDGIQDTQNLLTLRPLDTSLLITDDKLGHRHRTPLEVAMAEGDLDAFKQLLKDGADPNGLTVRNMNPPLFTALTFGNVEFVRLLLRAGANPNLPQVVGARNDYLAYSGDERLDVVGTLLQAVLIKMCRADGAGAGGIGSGGPRSVYQNLCETDHKRMEVLRDIALELIEWGADINAPPAEPIGRTALQAAAELKDDQIACKLLAYGADVKIAPSTHLGVTALQAAVYANNIGLVHLFLGHCADVNAPACKVSGFTALQAARSFEMVKLLVEHGADINGEPSEIDGLLCLQAAVETGDPSAVEYLLRKGARLETPSEILQSVLLAAINIQISDATKKRRIVEALLNAGADPNETGYVYKLNRGTVGWRPHSARTIHISTPLELAASILDYETTNLLIDNGARIGVSVDDDDKLIWISIVGPPAKDEEISGFVDFLLSKGARPRWYDMRRLQETKSSLYSRPGCFFDDTIQPHLTPSGDYWKISEGSLLDGYHLQEYAILRAVASGNRVLVESLLSATIGNPMEVSRVLRSYHGRSCWNCGEPRCEMKCLEDSGLHSTSPYRAQRRSLYAKILKERLFTILLKVAILSCNSHDNSTAMIQVMLDHMGPDTGLVQRVLDEETLHEVLELDKNDFVVQMLLLDAGFKNIAPHSSVVAKNLVDKFLLKTFPTPNDWSLFYTAALQIGPDAFDAPDAQTTLAVRKILLADVLTYSDNILLVELLFEKWRIGAEIVNSWVHESGTYSSWVRDGHIRHRAVTDGSGRYELVTPLQIAARSGNREIVEYLIELGADVNAAAGASFDGRTALQMAAEYGNMELVKLLIKKGADVNAEGSPHGNGITALQGAAGAGYLAIVVFLLENGADANAVTIRDGHVIGTKPSALDFAANYGRLDVVHALIKAGAIGEKPKITELEGETDPSLETAVNFDTAIDLATRGEHFVVAELLREEQNKRGKH